MEVVYKDGSSSELRKTAFKNGEKQPNTWEYEYFLSRTNQNDILSTKFLSPSVRPLKNEYNEILALLKPQLEGF